MTCSDAHDIIALWFSANFLKELLKFSFLEQNQNSSVFWIQGLHNLAPYLSKVNPSSFYKKHLHFHSLLTFI